MSKETSVDFLSQADDLLTLILLDLNIFGQLPTNGRRTCKMNPLTRELRFARGDPEAAAVLVKEVRSGLVPVAESYGKLIELTCVKNFMARWEDDIPAFKTHARKYLQALRPDSGVSFFETDRYSKLPKSATVRQTPSPTPPPPSRGSTSNNNIEVAVFATRRFAKGEVVQLKGGVANLSEDQDDALRASGDQKDFSVLHSARKGCFSLLLGPARFVNHDCRNNVEFQLTGNHMSFKVVEAIEPDEQLFTHYGGHYFEENNAACLCSTCEQLQRGAFAPALKPTPAPAVAPPKRAISPSRRSSRAGPGLGHELTANRSLSRSTSRSSSLSSLSSLSSSRSPSPSGSGSSEARNKRRSERTVLVVDEFRTRKRIVHPKLPPPLGYAADYRWDDRRRTATYVGLTTVPSAPRASRVALGKRKREDRDDSSPEPPEPGSGKGRRRASEGGGGARRRAPARKPRKPVRLGARTSSRNPSAVFHRLSAVVGDDDSESELTELDGSEGDEEDEGDESDLTELSASDGEEEEGEGMEVEELSPPVVELAQKEALEVKPGARGEGVVEMSDSSMLPPSGEDEEAGDANVEMEEREDDHRNPQPTSEDETPPGVLSIVPRQLATEVDLPSIASTASPLLIEVATAVKEDDANPTPTESLPTPVPTPPFDDDSESDFDPEDPLKDILLVGAKPVLRKAVAVAEPATGTVDASEGGAGGTTVDGVEGSEGAEESDGVEEKGDDGAEELGEAGEAPESAPEGDAPLQPPSAGGDEGDDKKGDRPPPDTVDDGDLDEVEPEETDVKQEEPEVDEPAPPPSERGAPSEAGDFLVGRDEDDKEAAALLLMMCAGPSDLSQSPPVPAPTAAGYAAAPESVAPSPPKTSSASETSTGSNKEQGYIVIPQKRRRAAQLVPDADEHKPELPVNNQRSTRRHSLLDPSPPPVLPPRASAASKKKSLEVKRAAAPRSKSDSPTHAESSKPLPTDRKRGRTSALSDARSRSLGTSPRPPSQDSSSEARSTRRSQPIEGDLKDFLASPLVTSVAGGFDPLTKRYFATGKRTAHSPSPEVPLEQHGSSESRGTRRTQPIGGDLRDLLASPRVAAVSGGFDTTTKRYTSKKAAEREYLASGDSGSEASPGPSSSSRTAGRRT